MEAPCSYSVTLKIRVISLVKNILYVRTGETEESPCALLTLLLARTSGIIIHMNILIRLIATFREGIHEDPEDEVSNSRNGDDEDDYDQHHGRRT